MKRENSNKETYMKDITSKLNDFQPYFNLTTFITDEDSVLLFMVMPMELYTLNIEDTPY